jgi:hypothetical protein
LNNEHVDMFYLLAQGRLPLSAVDPTVLPNSLTPVFRAFEYLLEKPHVFPLSVPDVLAVASSRFHAKDVAKALLARLQGYDPPAATIESVQQSILLRKITDSASRQLASGKYNLTEIGALSSHVVSMGVRSLVQPISAPSEMETSRVNYITGIDSLDELVGGVHDELVVVSARPKNGKSNFFVNLVCLSPKRSFLYVTVADYGYADLCQVLHDCEPSVVARKNVHIADFTSFGATVLDVEAVIREIKPEIVIVDRAEELAPLTKQRERRWEVKSIFMTLRQFAKKYQMPMFTDSQQSKAGGESARADGEVSPDHMAEDTTGRLAVLDLFVGLQRMTNRVVMTVHGRRKSLPGRVEVRTNNMGRYI